MTKIRVLFNVLEVLRTEEVFPRVKSLGIEAISCFGHLGGDSLPHHFKEVAKEFKDVNVNLFHNPTYRNEPDWKDLLLKDGIKTVRALGELGIHNYPWMIECNLYGYWRHPLMGSYVHRDRLVEHFNTFYDLAHEANPHANVILVPYPSPLMNLNCGIHGWKDWFVKFAEKMKFDRIALDAHVGIWIQAISRKGICKRLTDAIHFIQEQGHSVLYVEVGYPTIGYKPPIGWYGWGREKDQVEVLRICHEVLAQMEVPYMQICEFMDPDPAVQVYESFFGHKGRLPRFFGVPVREEAHWGLLRKDGTEKEACKWVRSVTQS